MKRILITGSSGFVGKELVKVLKQNNYIIYPIDKSDGYDITDFNTLLNIPDFDCVVHLAGKLFVPESYTYPLDFYTTNVQGTLNVLELARIRNAKVIYFSSYLYGSPNHLPVDENHQLSPHNPYAQSKLIGEELCKAYNRDFGVKTIIFRPFNVYGKNQNLNFLIPSIINQCLKGEITLKDARPKRDFIYIEDILSAIQLAIKNEDINFGIYNLGSGISHSVSEVVDIIIKNMGININAEYTNEYRENEVLDCVANIDKIKKELNWTPKISLEEGLKMVINNY
jgi:UDP-glucose 4-epimerase